eukprot:598898-Prorocentrum_lima.AAC.1
MTSSLVGSEMCIRDRVFCSRAALNTTAGSALGFRLLADLAIRVLRQMPVSYTHLTLPTICSV